MVSILCTVHGCRAPLRNEERAWVCERSHSFDIARSGYCNLLQPQDRRSKKPGDARESVLARRRFLEAGHGDFLLRALAKEMCDLALPANAAVLDVGCGEGYFLGSLGQERRMEAQGVDLSLPAIDLAARRWPAAQWWIANADRFLPFADGSFDLALSIAGRRPASELKRVLKPGGHLLVAIPAEDDLIELREAVLGVGKELSRRERVVAELAGSFVLEAHQIIRSVELLDGGAIRDVFASTYR